MDKCDNNLSTSRESLPLRAEYTSCSTYLVRRPAYRIKMEHGYPFPAAPRGHNWTLAGEEFGRMSASLACQAVIAGQLAGSAVVVASSPVQ